MAYLEDPRKRAAEEKKIRIDHSDVHLENEKLAEKMVSDLDRLARQRHRQISNRDNEIRLLRKELHKMPMAKTSSAPSLHSSAPATTTTTTTATTTSSSFRRLRPPPAFVKIDVHVPQQSHSQGSDKDDTDDDSYDEDAVRKWRPMCSSKTVRLAWEDSGYRDREGQGGKGTKPEVKRVTREQIQLNNLDMNSIPTAWFTQVHQPSDVIPRRRRASSAHPSRPALTSTPVHTQRPQSETSCRPRPRRTKSAVPSTTTLSTTSTPAPEEDLHDDDSPPFFSEPQQLKKTEITRSRRQLMMAMGVRKGRGDSGEDAVNSNRVKFLTALRRERERLDGRVKMFLQSCDNVGDGGIGNRKAREFQTFVLPQHMTSEIQI